MADNQISIAELKRHRTNLVTNIAECEKRFGDAPELRTLRDGLKHIDKLIADSEKMSQSDFDV